MIIWKIDLPSIIKTSIIVSLLFFQYHTYHTQSIKIENPQMSFFHRSQYQNMLTYFDSVTIVTKEKICLYCNLKLWKLRNVWGVHKTSSSPPKNVLGNPIRIWHLFCSPKHSLHWFDDVVIYYCIIFSHFVEFNAVCLCYRISLCDFIRLFIIDTHFVQKICLKRN